MPDKLSIIADCLLLKGQNVVSVADDGSDEWNICSAAYDHGVAHLLEEHDWKFGTDIATLTRTGASDDDDFEDVYALPNGCLHLIWVRLDGESCTYKIVGNAIYLTDGDALAVTAKFVEEPSPDQWPAMFISAVKEWVNAGIESGLKKDQIEADRHLAKADAFLQRARTRTDQQEPKRALFKTRYRTARLVRRG